MEPGILEVGALSSYKAHWARYEAGFVRDRTDWLRDEAAFGPAYHKRPNGGASEIRSMRRQSVRRPIS
ncbi:MAG: hypothetical protein DME52_08915 [Verrucomicrobia bacterium]|nr:MAG: hypothetical protein DME52_08915 [Verrucomicrobiota bacterium]